MGYLLPIWILGVPLALAIVDLILTPRTRGSAQGYSSPRDSMLSSPA